MRTTLDLPDPLMRELKARVALEGVKLKDYLARMVEADLHRPALARSAPQRSPAPVFHRKAARPMPELSNARLNAMMDAQDAAKASRG
jgi:hypothetical protein